MAIAVTGASGHLGNTLVRKLAGQGEKVRAVFRSDPPYQLPAGAEAVYTELNDVEGLMRAFDGASTIFHTAGAISIGLGAKKRLSAVNVEGTKNVIKACLALGGVRLVYIGSIEAFDLLTCSYPVSENSPIHPGNTIMPYGRTKALATLAIDEAVRNRNLDAVTIIPTGFIGPHDYKLTPMTSMVRDFCDGKIPARIKGGFDFVDIRDVAAVAMAAATEAKAGQRYVVSGRYATVAEIFEILENLSGIRAPRFEIPSSLSTIWGGIAECFYALVGKQPRYTRKSLKILSLGVSVSSQKAKVDLGYAPRPIEESFSDTLEWLRCREPTTKQTE